jgi:hypothetical protein
MDPLRYLGSNISPGTMPAAVPGAMAGQATPSLSLPSASLPPGAVPGTPSPFMPPGFGAPGPQDAKYEAITQQDGSIVLHLKNPDGSLGPAVKIINPIKPRSIGPQ